MKKTIFISVGMSLVLGFICSILVYFYMPMDVIEIIGNNDQRLGATITTINGSDTLKNSRSVINTNFSNLNTNKIEVSTTSLPLLTTVDNLTSAASLATVGTITTGTWNADTLTVGYGGTGSTTLPANYILLGNGSNAITAVSGLGSSGQVLKSQGAGNPPIWDSTSFDETLAYDWTGQNTWAASSSFNGDTYIASSTFTGTSTFAVLPYLQDDPVNDQEPVRKSYAESNYRTQYFRDTGSMSSCSGTTGWQSTSFAHGFGTTPSFIKLTAITGYSVPGGHKSFGTYDGSNYETIGINNNGAAAYTDRLAFLASGDNANYYKATSTIDSTNVIVNVECNTYATYGLTYLIEAWVY